ncbi:helix-turn-helix transcriptional regulator [Mycobacteroides abscessus subsp. abscessus]|nr:helix-turn-helix transcriptional regulator [Mycobacteroides abscessus subsp. abscessus]QSM71721.1 helix-turn-helix transcriptional regulator [Mycobacteroides abscessus subsp. abscessus]
MAERVGKAVQDYRRRHGLTAQAFAARTADLGYPISRVAISKIESNSRAGKMDLAELIVLAAAMNTPPVALLYPAMPDGEVDLLPDRPVRSIVAALWFSGEISRSAIEAATDPDQLDDELNNMRRLQLSRRRAQLQTSIASTERVAAMSQQHLDRGAEDANPAAIRALIDLNRADLERLTSEISNRGWDVIPDA